MDVFKGVKCYNVDDESRRGRKQANLCSLCGVALRWPIKCGIREELGFFQHFLLYFFLPLVLLVTNCLGILACNYSQTKHIRFVEI